MTPGRVLANELAIVAAAARFLLGGWRRPLPAGLSYHRESALRLLLPALPLLLVGDALLFEFVVFPRLSLGLAIVLRVCSLYSLVWLVGMYALQRTNPHVLANGTLTLHRAHVRTFAIALDQIVSIEVVPELADDWKKRAYMKGALRLDVPGPTLLELRSHAGERVLFSVDDPSALGALDPTRS